MNDNSKHQDGHQPDKESGPEFLKEFQQAIQSYADAVNADKTEEADQAVMTAFLMAGAEAMAHPTPELDLAEKAEDFARAGEWEQAEAAYRKLLAMQERSGNPGLTVKPQLDLSSLFRLIGRLEEAWTLACAASALARRTEIYPLISMALDNQALCALARGDAAQALAAASEAVQVIEPGKIGDLSRGSRLALRATCSLACGDAEGAERDLKSSWELLGKRKLPGIGTGPVVALARWWEAQAELELRKANLAQGGVALAQAIEYRREGFKRSGFPSPQALAALARTLDKFAGIMEQTGDLKAKQEARAEARTIWSNLRLPNHRSSEYT